MKYATVVVEQFIRHSAEISLDALQILLLYMPAGESTLHGVLVHGFRSCSALFPVC